MNDKSMYLGDGLYFSDDGFQIRLWTERGIGVIHEVYLDDAVLVTFMRVLE